MKIIYQLIDGGRGGREAEREMDGKYTDGLIKGQIDRKKQIDSQT